MNYGGRDTRVRDVKGMAVIAKLLAEPGREFFVLDLIASGSPASGAAVAGDTGEVIDAQARRAYQHRLSDLETEIDDAAFAGDSVRRERAEAEREALIDQLASAYGLGGRARRGNHPIERARSTVTKQIHGAIARIDDEHPSLGLHLSNSVKTGRYCAYIPEYPVSWDL